MRKESKEFVAVSLYDKMSVHPTALSWADRHRAAFGPGYSHLRRAQKRKGSGKGSACDSVAAAALFKGDLTVQDVALDLVIHIGLARAPVVEMYEIPCLT